MNLKEARRVKKSFEKGKTLKKLREVEETLETELKKINNKFIEGKLEGIKLAIHLLTKEE